MSVTEALPGFTTATESATSTLPELDTIIPPENGITLLDAKNEIFLSYLQTLALRNLEVIRSVKPLLSKSKHSENVDATAASKRLQDQMVHDLVKHRLYLEKGVRPLEERLKYQIDKVVRAADDEERRTTVKTKAQQTIAKADDASSTGSKSDDDDEEDQDDEANELAYRPNPASFARPVAAATSASRGLPDRAEASTDGVYRPPRITATSMPTTEGRREKRERPSRSATMDEYVADEYSTAPLSQPSIGSTIVDGGRRDKSARERAQEDERREYEETHLTRLPKESKKDRLKKQGGRDRGGGFGGEEWRHLGGDLDRIERLTKRKGREGALEKSRKRRAVEDGPRGDGAAGPGAEFEKRRKKIMRRM